MSYTPTPFIENINNSNWIEVSQESDFGEEVTPGEIELAANTVYFVRGEITINSNLICNVEGVEIVGTDRNSDHLIWNGVGVLLTVTDVNFGIRGLRFSSNNVSTSILDATNVAAAGYNFGRLKVLTIFNCQFRGTYDVIDVKGFDLVDINNNLFFYIKATNFGLRFQDTSKIQLSSCELIRWFDETNIANSLGAWSAGSYSIGDIVTEGPIFYKALTNNIVQPSTSIGVDWEASEYATVSMIELQANNLASFGAVNINGCIIHPQQTQVGIDIDTASTTGFGTISGNAFINIGLTTGKVFLPEVAVLLLPDYSQTATKTYDIFANQGILNSIAYGSFYDSTSGTNTLTGGTTDWIPVEYGAVPVAAGTQRVSFSTPATQRGLLTYNGTKTIFAQISVSFVYNDTTGGSDQYNFGLSKSLGSTPVIGSIISTIASGGSYFGVTVLFTDTMVTGDNYELLAQNDAGAVGDDIEVISVQFLIKE